MSFIDPVILSKAQSWLDGNVDAATKSSIQKLLAEHPAELVDSFYQDLEFGTGGLRGLMGVGTNRMNVYTVGMATQGLANYLLKCFVLIDLKTGNLAHQDIGQIDMYVRMYDDLKRSSDDNPTIGILLCSEKDETIVKYSVLNDKNNIYASKYLLYLPKEEELKQIIEQDRLNFELDSE
jgi:hypothetical protein